MKSTLAHFTKNSIVLIVLLIAAILVFPSCKSAKKDAIPVIGKKGNISAIIIPAHANEVTKFAAGELREYFKKMTGTELLITETDGKENKEPAIRLVIEDNPSIKWDGFVIDITNTTITLSAKESRAILYAAYSLLEQAGCAFFYPGEKEEIVPNRDTVQFEPRHQLYNPVLEHRGLAPYGLQGSSIETGRNFISWMAKNKLNYILVSENRPSDSDGPAHGSIWKEVTGELLPELQKRGFIIEMSEHCAPVFFPTTLFKDHPDWFAMNNGVRKLGKPPYSGQMCYSNKDAVEFYANAIAAYASKHPEFHTIGTWPLDGGEYCECENCKVPATVFRAAMRVAEKVKAVRPEMIVEHLAYKTQTWQAPVKKMPANMSVLWCPDLGAMDSLAKEWIQKSKGAGGAYLFEYYMGDNYRTCDNVWLRPAYSAKVAAQATEIGFRGVISLFLPMQNWWRSSFNNWFFARGCWDTAFNINAGLNSYCKAYYGVQAVETEKIFQLILTGFQPEPYTRPIESAGKRLVDVTSAAGVIIKKVDNLIAQATEPMVATRLKRVRTYVEYSLLHCQAFASLKKLDLDRLISYSREHTDQNMVLMYPEYIRWRNEEYFIK